MIEWIAAYCVLAFFSFGFFAGIDKVDSWAVFYGVVWPVSLPIFFGMHLGIKTDYYAKGKEWRK